MRQWQHRACYANGLPKVGGKKRPAASLADEDTSERDGGEGLPNPPPALIELWDCYVSDLFVQDRSGDVLLYNQGELSVGASSDLGNRIHLGGPVADPPPRSAYFECMSDLREQSLAWCRLESDMDEWGRKGVEMLVPGLLEEGKSDWAAGTGAGEGAEPRGSSATQRVGDGDEGDPPADSDHEEEAPLGTHSGRRGRATRGERRRGRR